MLSFWKCVDSFIPESLKCYFQLFRIDSAVIESSTYSSLGFNRLFYSLIIKYWDLCTFGIFGCIQDSWMSLTFILFPHILHFYLQKFFFCKLFLRNFKIERFKNFEFKGLENKAKDVQGLLERQSRIV